MKEIELTKGYKAIVDDEDFDYLSKFKWHAQECPPDRMNKIVYAMTGVGIGGKKNVIVPMHRVVLSFKENDPLFLVNTDEYVDHIDNNGLNNTRKNIRRCTNSQNQLRKCIQKNNSSGFAGISFDKKSKKYVARINLGIRQRKYLGIFGTFDEAKKAYEEELKTLDRQGFER